MNREDIIRMGAESKISLYSLGKEKEKFINYLEHFAALVAQQEREACANVCEKFAEDMTVLAKWGASQCANAIRAKGQA